MHSCLGRCALLPELPREMTHTSRSTTRQPARIIAWAWESIRACHTHCCSPLICVWPFSLLLVAIDRSYAVRIWTRHRLSSHNAISTMINCLQKIFDETVDLSLLSPAPLPVVVIFQCNEESLLQYPKWLNLATFTAVLLTRTLSII